MMPVVKLLLATALLSGLSLPTAGADRDESGKPCPSECCEASSDCCQDSCPCPSLVCQGQSGNRIAGERPVTIFSPEQSGETVIPGDIELEARTEEPESPPPRPWSPQGKGSPVPGEISWNSTKEKHQ